MDNEIKELEERKFNIHSQATSTNHIPTRKMLMNEEGAIDLKLQHLRNVEEEEQEKEYYQKNQTQIIENRAFIFFSANGERIFIDAKGCIEFTFMPCGHKKTMQISELQLHTHQNNQSKFETWRRLLKENITYNGAMNCQECLNQKRKKFKIMRRYNNKPIPKLSWELRRLR